MCWIWKDSVTAHQLGSGLQGLGIGSFGLDWSTVAGFLGSPLVYPGFAILNIMAGYIIVIYIILPIMYWNNAYGSKRFPLISPGTYDDDGRKYNVSAVLNSTTFSFNREGYDNYSKVNLSMVFSLSYGLSFATLAAAISHVVLFHGRYIYQFCQCLQFFTDRV